MGPTKAVIKGNTLYEAVSGKLIKDGFANPKDIEDYVNHHYIMLPTVDRQGRPWLLDGKPVYCLRGAQYETVDDQKVHSHVVRIAEAWGSDPTNSWWSRMSSAALPVDTNSTPAGDDGDVRGRAPC